MKSKLYQLIFCLIITNFYSQKLTIAELESLSKKDFEEFSLFALSKNYTLLNSKESEVTYYYTNLDLNSDSFTISKKDNAQNQLLVYMVSNKTDYLKLIEQLKSRGYNYTGSDNLENAASSTYVKNDKQFIATTLIMKEFYKIYIGPTNYKK